MTNQVKDNCKYLGSEYQMPSCLGFPVDNSKIEELSSSDLESIDSNGIYFSTACWRNYIATWEVQGNKLYLVNLEGKYRLVDNEPLFASWYSGIFELPQGDLVDCNVELGFQLSYTKAVKLKFVAGILVESTLRDII
ncbi:MULTISPECIES: hypothetical protein [Vibrio]|uniref:hypothetical protein n=1 Tax=Vibrio TaxID=662 RepID=UPI0003670E5B|nr:MULTISPECIES: hypothetical protein [Vibrio]EHH0804905.1 hypothetical protein [Vibrio vulnificus]EIX4890092.1 hypothetical protein [Vibrio vulnificus]OEF05979.1 hypothetical protein A1QI_18740 [Vibrio genomosp. F10 str. 9ZB36]POC16626.1 hypothetical protein CRN42_19070 [Vibrio vulnificus]TMX33785.1 hypothetical protein DA095_16490 [Vibrio rotiferianus]